MPHAWWTGSCKAEITMAMPGIIEGWTLADLHRLPDDGNRYELVGGELFVTPPPSVGHQELVEVLAELLLPYVMAHHLGRLRFPRSVIRRGRDNEVEPDLMVRPVSTRLPQSWEQAPVPLLVVEVVSAATRRRDRVRKRAFYLDMGIPEYWIVDREHRLITVVRQDADDADYSDELAWHPAGADAPLIIDVALLFRTALRS